MVPGMAASGHRAKLKVADAGPELRADCVRSEHPTRAPEAPAPEAASSPGGQHGFIRGGDRVVHLGDPAHVVQLRAAAEGTSLIARA